MKPILIYLFLVSTFFPSLSEQFVLKTNDEMVLIPGGEYRMGSTPREIHEAMQRYQIDRREFFSPEVPSHVVKVDSFLMDRYEVTNKQYRKFILENPEWRKVNIPDSLHNGEYLKHWEGDKYPSGQGDHPVIYVSWYSAMTYAEWEGKRLPTEAEWEYAASGGLVNPEFPWGDDLPDTTRVNYWKSGLKSAIAVGSYSPNGYGLYDISGNVWEYCIDEWRDSVPSTQLHKSLKHKTFKTSSNEFYQVKTRRVIRGGSWGGAVVNLRVSYRDSHPPKGAGDHVGFRCVKTLDSMNK